MAYHFNNRIEILGITSELNSEFESMGFDATKKLIRFIIKYRKELELNHKIKYAGDVSKATMTIIN